MADPAPQAGAHTLMCEDCGYILEGLPLSASCSERGRPVAASMPHHREGSPWQQRPSISSWFDTNLTALRKPRELFSRIRVEPSTGTWLLILNCLLAAFLIVAPWSGTLIADPTRSARGHGPIRELLTFTWVLPIEIGAAAITLFFMTWLEYVGVRFFAAHRGWRFTREGAWQVCCHASVGWIVLGLAPLLALALIYTVGTYFGVPLGRTIRIASATGLQVSIGTALSVTLPAFALFFGLFVYELLVHLGVRRCRFAAALPASPA